MSRLTLRLPETLHQTLIHVAQNEGVSLHQYIVDVLASQVGPKYTAHPLSEDAISQQKTAFEELQQKLGNASSSEIKAALDEREWVQPEEELTPDIVARIQKQITNNINVDA